MENYLWIEVRGKMKKSDLKRLIKPIVKECINEALIEQGLLSNIIAEVVTGLQPLQAQRSLSPTNKQILFQQEQLKEQQKGLELEKQQQAKEQKRKLLDAAGFGSDIFAGTTPIHEASDPTNGQGDALTGIDPSDAGVDIKGIMAVANRDWGKMI